MTTIITITNYTCNNIDINNNSNIVNNNYNQNRKLLLNRKGKFYNFEQNKIANVLLIFFNKKYFER